MVVGPAMHLIGALCIICQLPVAPLYWVTRADNEPKDVFASDVMEAKHVLPHHSTLYVVSRDYGYSRADFDAISRRLKKMLLETEKYPSDWTPHFMWHQVILKHPKNSTQTYFERALQRYESLFEELRTQRKKSR
jgi:hypothetical protein